MLFNLTDRVALVTGGSRGLGKSIVLELARAGAAVAFCYRNNDAAAQNVAATAKAEYVKQPFVVQADITLEQDRIRLVSEVSQHLGGLDILVNNAGTRHDGIALRMGKAWERVLDLNLTAPFRLSQLALRLMTKRAWGRIINIGSVASHIGLSGQANYAASKAGLEGLTRSLAQEYGKKGITVNTLNPGLIETDLTGDASALVKELVEHRTALDIPLTPEAVASAVVFLASEEAWAITGQTINVDCGLVKP